MKCQTPCNRGVFAQALTAEKEAYLGMSLRYKLHSLRRITLPSSVSFTSIRSPLWPVATHSCAHRRITREWDWCLVCETRALRNRHLPQFTDAVSAPPDCTG